MSIFIPYLSVFLLAMSPVFELRGAIPFGKLKFGLPFIENYLLAVLGNATPVFPILLLLEPSSNFLRARFKFADRFFLWLFGRTRKRLSGSLKKYGILGLMFFVAIPLPVTGAWTGCAGAFVFDLPRKRAFIAIVVGIAISGLIVSSTVYLGVKIFSFL